VNNQSTQEHITKLQCFRQQIYSLFDNRRDSLFELMDAIVQTPHANSFAELSLAASSTRKWHSSYKALSDGSLEEAQLRRLCFELLPDKQLLHFAIDVMATRRMHSPTLKERLFCHTAKREVSGKGVIIGLPYSLLAFVEGRSRSWAPTLHTQRIRPGEKAVEVAVEQARWLADQLEQGQGAALALDGSYGNREFFAKMRRIKLLAVARMRDDRRLYRRPPTASKQKRRPGRPRKYGKKFCFAERATWGPASEVLEFNDSSYGQTRLEMWRDLRFRLKGEVVEISVVRCQIHLEREKRPKARWYGVHNSTSEDVSLSAIFECIVHRWPIEPANRFRKQRLFAELPKVRQAESSDLWMMLLQLTEWQLYLWREAAKDERLPWQKPLPTDRLTPGRVIRSLSANIMRVGSPVSQVLPRGKSSGWPPQRVRKRPLKYRLESKRRKRLLEMSKNE
jgi:hypothetical protein